MACQLGSPSPRLYSDLTIVALAVDYSSAVTTSLVPGICNDRYADIISESQQILGRIIR